MTRPANILALAALATLAVNPVVPLRRRLPALVPGDRRAGLAGAAGRRGNPTRRRGDPRPDSRAPPLRWTSSSAGSSRDGGTWMRTGAAKLSRRRRLDGRLAGRAAAGGAAVPHRLADRHPAEHPADPDHVNGDVARRTGARALGDWGPWVCRPPGPPACCSTSPSASCCGASANPGATDSSPARAGDGSWSSTSCSCWPPSRRTTLRVAEARGSEHPGGRRRIRRRGRLRRDAAGGCWRRGRWAAGCSPSSRSAVDARGRRAGRRARAGGGHPDARRPVLALRLRADGRSVRRAADHRAGPLVARDYADREVILSHADQDHFNGLPDLLDRFAVGTVRIPPGFGGPANPAADRLIAAVRSRGIPIRTTAAPETWEAGGVQFAAQHPPAGWYLEAPDNARSLVLDVAYAGRHLLLTGDLEAARAHRADVAPSSRSAAGRHAGPAPRRSIRQPGLALRLGRSRGRRGQPAGPARGTSDALTSLDRRTSPSGGPGATGRSDCGGRIAASSQAGSWPGTIHRPRGRWTRVDRHGVRAGTCLLPWSASGPGDSAFGWRSAWAGSRSGRCSGRSWRSSSSEPGRWSCRRGVVSVETAMAKRT